MAIVNVIDGVAAAVNLAAATPFSITEATPILADKFGVLENAIIWRLGPSGDYEAATNKQGTIILSAIPNTALLEAPGTYKVTKDVTVEDAYVGYGS